MPEQSMTLYEIDDTIAQLVEMRAEMLAAGEDVAAVEGELQRYLGETLPAKVEGYVGIIRQYDSMAQAAVAESDRLRTIAAIFKGRVAWIKDTALSVLVGRGLKKLVGTRGGVIRVQANGGKQALDIYDEGLVPDEYKAVAVTFTATDWPRVSRILKAYSIHVTGGTYQVLTDSVRRALDEPCHACGGVAQAGGDPSCDVCEGRLKQIVPGARLMERGSHLRVE